VLKVIPFEAPHVELLDEQEQSRHLTGHISAAEVRALKNEYAYTGVADGQVMVCAGVMPMWEGRGQAWCYLSRDSGRHLVAITRAVRRFLDIAPFVRLEMTVDCSFDAGHRWARMLGFKCEAERMVAYGPDDRDYALYARVKL
jgi:hypothetical protein